MLIRQHDLSGAAGGPMKTCWLSKCQFLSILKWKINLRTSRKWLQSKEVRQLAPNWTAKVQRWTEFIRCSPLKSSGPKLNATKTMFSPDKLQHLEPLMVEPAMQDATETQSRGHYT